METTLYCSLYNFFVLIFSWIREWHDILILAVQAAALVATVIIAVVVYKLGVRQQTRRGRTSDIERVIRWAEEAACILSILKSGNPQAVEQLRAAAVGLVLRAADVGSVPIRLQNQDLKQAWLKAYNALNMFIEDIDSFEEGAKSFAADLDKYDATITAFAGGAIDMRGLPPVVQEVVSNFKHAYDAYLEAVLGLIKEASLLKWELT
jgi:hypothetical protein